MGEHIFVMTEHNISLRAQRRIRSWPPGPEPISHLAGEPWPSTTPATDHQAVGARLLQCLIGVFKADDIAIGDYRNSHRRLDETDELPVGGAGVKLAACAAMDSDHADAAR